MRGKLVLFFILSIVIGFIASANLALADNGDVTPGSEEHHEKAEHETAAQPVPAGFKLADPKPDERAEANTEPEAKTEAAKDETETESATVDDRATEASEALEWSLPSTDGQLSKDEQPEAGDEAGSKPEHSTEAESTPEDGKEEEAHSTVDDDKEARNSASESSEYQSATSEAEVEESELSSTGESASNDPTSDKHGEETGSSNEGDEEASSKAKDETDAESSSDGDNAVATESSESATPDEGSTAEEPEASSDESRDHWPRTTKPCKYVKDTEAITDKKGECNKCCEKLHPHYFGDYRDEGGCVCHTKTEHRHLSRLLSQPILGEVPKEDKPEAGNEAKAKAKAKAEAESESEHKTEADPTSGGTTLVEPTPESATPEKPREDITSEILKPESPKPEEPKYVVHGPANAPQEQRLVCKIDKKPACLSCLFGTNLKERCRKCCKKTHGREGTYRFGECVCGNLLPKKRSG